MKSLKNSTYIAIGVGAVFSFILIGIFLFQLPVCVRRFLSIITTVICFLTFGGGLYFIPKQTLKLNKDKVLITSAVVFMLANFIFMYTTYALGYERIYPYLYGIGFNLITALGVCLIAIFSLFINNKK